MDPMFQGCIATMDNSVRTGVVTDPYSLVYEGTIICSCTVLMCCILYFRWKWFRHASRMSPLINRVFRGALTFYYLELAFSALAIASYFLKASLGFLPVITLITNPAVAAIITTRVILDVKDLGAEGCYTTSIYPAKSISTIRFHRVTQVASDDNDGVP
ncbi:hypothetical protein AN958_03924 [Leucoagaricus sp. SymC.cos]|nr:hypothetical protein AN958_03924 [Leucoagaricus sp. SymC.cos]